MRFARLNAEANGVRNTRFVTGAAEGIFELVQTPADRTALIIDPPRKVRVLTSFCPPRQGF